ncbi:MAG: MoxR family ATPase [Spirochaetales bacterium]|nr:MoxR family ATPase [Spirochaetales bacterium]
MNTNVKKWTGDITDEIEKVFFGKRRIIRKLLCALLARGHVLLEDVPGTGKTILARAVSAVLGADFSRIQCMPDLLPADVLGVSVWSPDKSEFIYRKGPIISNIVLVDEINRATPRTQSALLEAMAERRISIDGRILPLPEPFFIMATENPVEFEGTFPLPEAQKDRFLFSISLGYPEAEAEALMLENQRCLEHPITNLTPITSPETIIAMQKEVVEVYVDTALRDYMLALVHGSRNDPSVRLGVSPRGSLALYRAAQAMAAMDGRNYIVPEDVQEIVPDVFRKRIIPTPDASLKSITSDRIVSSLLDTIPVPTLKAGA